MFIDLETEEKINKLTDPTTLTKMLNHIEHMIWAKKVNISQIQTSENEEKAIVEYRESLLVGNNQLGAFANHMITIHMKPHNTMKFIKRLYKLIEALAEERRILENRELSIQNNKTAKYTLWTTLILLFLTVIAIIMSGVAIYFNRRGTG